jgi:hypothetical protein
MCRVSSCLQACKTEAPRSSAAFRKRMMILAAPGGLRKNHQADVAFAMVSVSFYRE